LSSAQLTALSDAACIFHFSSLRRRGEPNVGGRESKSKQLYFRDFEYPVSLRTAFWAANLLLSLDGKNERIFPYIHVGGENVSVTAQTLDSSQNLHTQLQSAFETVRTVRMFLGYNIWGQPIHRDRLESAFHIDRIAKYLLPYIEGRRTGEIQWSFGDVGEGGSNVDQLSPSGVRDFATRVSSDWNSFYNKNRDNYPELRDYSIDWKLENRSRRNPDKLRTKKWSLLLNPVNQFRRLYVGT